VTLRLRLVAAIVLLATAGLILFGVVTYSLYSNSEYQSLDHQLQASVDVIGDVLSPGGHGRPPDGNGGGGGGPGSPGGGGLPSGTHGGPPPILVPYGALYNADGKVVASLPLDSEAASIPRLPAGALSTANVNKILTTGSVSGSTTWRMLITRALGSQDYLVLATPTTAVTSALHDLVLIETSAAVGLLILLSLGAGVVLRRGLRPLEHMAATARLISGGDLSQRVETTGDKSEVGQLGSAFNTMLEDIAAAFTARDMTEERLRQFLADASHELRTPLTSIKGFAELARLRQGAEPNPVSPSDTTEKTAGVVVDPLTALDRIEDQAGRMSLLVEDLLLLARLDDRRPTERKPVDLTVVAADACSEAVAMAPKRKITLDGREPVVVLGDEAHLRQAISNLMTNALRHTAAGTPIEVSSRVEGGEAVVSVRDHGHGLDAEALAHVFDRFWRADSSRSTVGSGLGLSIVQAVAAEHEGRAEAGNSDGGGGRFSLVLPLSEPAARSAGVPSAF
jgi:two-component system OmpR family sensor kinase